VGARRAGLLVRADASLLAAAFPDCRKSNGKSLSGRKCCEKVNANFMIENIEPSNPFPHGGEVNVDRSNFPFGEVNGEPRVYGSCDFEFDGSVAEPGAQVRGELACARHALHVVDLWGRCEGAYQHAGGVVQGGPASEVGNLKRADHRRAHRTTE